MKQSVNFYTFEQAFKSARPNNFSYAGLKALFNYLEEYEENTGEEYELDVIGVCCDFTEYENIREFIDAYSDDYIIWDEEPEGTEDGLGVIDYMRTLDKISEYTTVIDIDGESFIIQDF